MNLEEEEKQHFRRWLGNHTSLSDRSIGDVISRVRRVMRMVDPLAPESDDVLELRLKQSGEFADCSVSVQSQLKRAARLYRRFHSKRGQGEWD